MSSYDFHVLYKNYNKFALNNTTMGLNMLTGGSSNIVSSFASKATNSITSALGCPSLSSLGLSFSNLKKLFSHEDDTTTTELKDLSLQTSTYKKVIPEVFGKVRIAGNIIWASPIKTTNIYHAQKTTKSGTQGAYTEKLVRGSFAIAVCKGKVDAIKNIYADGEPLNKAAHDIQIYLGTEDQMPNPTMQGYLGADIPAFRGLCYVVFHEFPMEQFGNRIPNFTFDVVRQEDLQSDNDIENVVKSVVMIPGSGEFVYDTKTQKKLNGNLAMGYFFETAKATIINNHTSSQNTDAVDSLQDLQNTFKNLEWVSLVVCWFCDSTNCTNASVYPACEFNSTYTQPDQWSVAGNERTEARVIGQDEHGNIRYGGTPDDASVLRYVQEMKRRGLKVCLYPMLMVDTNGKPWRGHITCGAGLSNAEKTNAVHNFFTKNDGYNKFIEHYVNLLGSNIDAVIIGSEMKGLTSIYAGAEGIENEEDYYPAVNEFCSLAHTVKNIVGNNVKVIYAADWSEYHHDDRGNYNMDKLWACNDIDVIGIDAYFPLTDKSETTYDIDEIANGWRSGEGYDWYYSDGARTQKASLSSAWAWKNVEYFWGNYHYNRHGNATAWVPQSKKIWFTEYGFPSVDCCTNQPNVFYSEGSLDSAFPRFSSGNADFKAQRVAIYASEMAWKNSPCVERIFLYTWDARPYPEFPNLSSVWSDVGVWKYGHFLNGKAGNTTLANVIKNLCLKAGLQEGDFDTSLIHDEMLNGYVIDDKNTILKHIRILADAYNFDAYIDGGRICFKSLKDVENHVISEENLLLEKQPNGSRAPAFVYEIASNENIPSAVELLFLDVDKDYTTSTALARSNSTTDKKHSVSVPMPLNISQAQEVAWRILSNISTQNVIYKLKLPICFASIAPLDTISINVNGESHLMRVKSVRLVDMTTVEIVGISIVANDNILTNLEYTSTDLIAGGGAIKETTSYIPKTEFELFELYNIDNEIYDNKFVVYCAVWSEDSNWQGANLYYSTDDEYNYNALTWIDRESCVGKLMSFDGLNDAGVRPYLLDLNTRIVVSMTDENGKLQSITDEAFSELGNKILVGEEIICFREVRQLSATTFELSHLLRGRFNTEDKMHSHTIGERVILLDDDVYKMELPITYKGKEVFVKAVSLNDTIQNNEAKSLTLQALSVLDFSIQNKQISQLQNGDLKLSFSVRKNYKLNDNIFQPNFAVRLTIYDKQTRAKKREIRLQNATSFIYYYSDQICNFGYSLSSDLIDFDVVGLVV